MKKALKFVVLGLLLLVVVLFSGCEKENAQQSQVEQEEIKVGVIIPMSGALAPYEDVFRETLSLFESTVNEDENYSKKIKFIFEDNQGDAQTTVNIVNKMKNVDGIKIFYVPFSGPSMALEQMAKDGEIFMMAENYDPEFAKKDKALFNSGIAKDLEKAYGQLLEKFGTCQNLYVVGLGVSSGQRIKTMTEETHEEAIVELVPASANDFKTVILKIKENDSRCVIPYLYEYQLAIFLKQAKELGLETNFGFVSTADYEKLLENLGNYPSDGYLVTAAVFPNMNKSSLGKKFFEEYLEKNGDALLNFAVEAFDGATVLKQVSEKCDADDISCFVQETEKIELFEGATNPQTRIDEDGDIVGREFVVLEIRDGKVVRE